ncbi:MAG: DUF6516 family protein [Thiotrichaceae bacterium]|nr:DUF6516 family protein [Thiotrichaceae bacterium]
MNLQKVFDNYISKIWLEISKHQNIVDFHKQNIRPFFDKNKKKGLILAKTIPLKFKKDNATLAVYEEIVFINNQLHIDKYEYHYERYRQDGSIEFYFRYDKDPYAKKPDDFSQEDWDISHAVHHLHVGEKEPRYKTHETNFIEVFNIIRLNYYNPKIST